MPKKNLSKGVGRFVKGKKTAALPVLLTALLLTGKAAGGEMEAVLASGRIFPGGLQSTAADIYGEGPEL